MDSLSTIILGVSLIIVILGMGLSLTVSDFKRVLKFPKAVFIGLVNQLLLLPLIGLTIVSVLPMTPEIAVGVMILVACPGGPTSNLISHLSNADLALSVTLTAISSLVTIVTIPFIVNYALENLLNQQQTITLSVLETILQIAIIVVIPICIGMFIKHKKPNFALKMAKPVRIASAFVLGLIIIGLIIKEREHMISYFKQAGIATLLLNLITMGIGYSSARLFALKKPQALSIAIESGIQNGTLAITIAVVLLGNTSYAIAPAVYSIFMFITGGFIIYYGVTGIKKSNTTL